jgi:hypothetical protein
MLKSLFMEREYTVRPRITEDTHREDSLATAGHDHGITALSEVSGPSQLFEPETIIHAPEDQASLEQNEGVHPDVLAKMALWDRLTGRSSNRTGLGPLSAEHRRKIGDAQRISPDKEQVVFPGQPLPPEVRAKIGEAQRRYQARKRGK